MPARRSHQAAVSPEIPPPTTITSARDPHAEAILRIPKDFAKDWQAGRPAPIEIIADRIKGGK